MSRSTINELEIAALDTVCDAIGAWVDATFEPVNRPDCFALKAIEEAHELLDSRAPHEAADTLIALLAWCYVEHVNLGVELAARLRVLWERTDAGAYSVVDQNGVTLRPDSELVRLRKEVESLSAEVEVLKAART